MNELVLSLFPGIGLLDMAFEEQEFCVVRGPDKLCGGNIKNFHPPVAKFDGIIGGPPCQCFSQLRYVNLAAGVELAENLIPEFERVVLEAFPKWFLMENVANAPEPGLEPYYHVRSILLNARWFGAEQERKRRFSFGTQVAFHSAIDLSRYLDVNVFEDMNWSPAVCASGGIKPGVTGDRKTRLKYMGWKTATALKESIRLQGLPEDFLRDAPFTLEGKHKVVGNGVPLPLGRAIAQAVAKVVRLEAL